MLNEKWIETFDKLESFTNELEKATSYPALQEFKSLWRIMKSVQLKHTVDLPEAYVQKLDFMVNRLDIREVGPSSFTVQEAVKVLESFCVTCSVDPDLF